MSRLRARLRALSALALVLSALAWLGLAPVVAAHGGVEVGEYVLTIGWRSEPAIVNQPNGVQLFVANHHDESPVNRGVSLSVVVSTADRSTDALELTPQFVVGEFGTPGEYGADLIPTTTGDYAFHFTGTIGDTDVDVEMRSSDAEAFSPILSASELEFPVKLPNLADVATRLDRIDGRIAALQSQAPDTAALDAANAAADAARTASAAADRAMLLGVAVGGLGVLAGLVGIAIGIRAGRRGTTSA